MYQQQKRYNRQWIGSARAAN